MPKRDRTGRTVAILGGAALAAWLLLRGKRWGFRSPNAHPAGGTTRPARCVVWIRPERLTVDGVVADLQTVIARCRAAGEAEVHATGDAITGVVWNVLKALHAAGVALYTPADLAHVVPSRPLP